jgi:hypothetical protein
MMATITVYNSPEMMIIIGHGMLIGHPHKGYIGPWLNSNDGNIMPAGWYHMVHSEPFLALMNETIQ